MGFWLFEKSGDDMEIQNIERKYLIQQCAYKSIKLCEMFNTSIWDIGIQHMVWFLLRLISFISMFDADNILIKQSQQESDCIQLKFTLMQFWHSFMWIYHVQFMWL